MFRWNISQDQMHTQQRQTFKSVYEFITLLTHNDCRTDLTVCTKNWSAAVPELEITICRIAHKLDSHALLTNPQTLNSDIVNPVKSTEISVLTSQSRI